MFGIDTHRALSLPFPVEFLLGGRKVLCRAANCGKIGISSRVVATSPEVGLFYSVECAIRELIPPKVSAH